jgi:hypothetical protein
LENGSKNLEKFCNGRYWNSYHLAEYITGAKITDVCAELNTLVEVV